MDRIEFLNSMRKTLVSNNIPDIEEIVSEYAQHFEFKIADGYSEEEVAAKLGDPKLLAAQFTLEKGVKSDKAPIGFMKIITIIGLFFADLFAFCLFVTLFAWVILVAAMSAASLAIAGCLLFSWNIAGILPQMPYASAVVFAVAFLALAVLAAIATVYCFLFFKQLLHAYFRWHHNILASASGNPVLPSLSTYPKLDSGLNRRMRNTALSSLIVFAVFFLGSYVLSSILASSPGFWHVWNWFQ